MSKKYWEKTKKINLKPLERGFEFVYTNNIAKARNERSKKLGTLKKPLGKYVDGLWCNNKDKFVLFIDKKASTGVIAHEAYHAVIDIFRYIGVEQYDDELVAYHIGYIVDQITKFIKK